MHMICWQDQAEDFHTDKQTERTCSGLVVIVLGSSEYLSEEAPRATWDPRPAPEDLVTNRVSATAYEGPDLKS